MGLNFKKWFKDEENDVFGVDGVEDSYYALKPEEALKDNNGGSKMILLEPRAYSESQQIVDHLKNRNTVVVNLKRVTSDQAKRIVDFGDIQKIGGGIFLCTPNNVNIQGSISDERDGKDIHDNDDINIEW